MRVTFQKRAGEDEIFAPDAFTSQVGREVSVTAGGRFLGMVTIAAAEVAEDGKSVLITYEGPTEVLESFA